MFRKACDVAGRFTRPVIMTVQTIDGQIGAGIGAFVVINADGWAVTAAHVANDAIQREKDAEEVARFDDRMTELRSEVPNKQVALRRKYDKDLADAMRGRGPLLRRAGLMWCDPAVTVALDHTFIPADLMICKFDNIERLEVEVFPKFKRPQGLLPGTSLVRAGYPFNEAKCNFDPVREEFVNETQVPTLFAIEGILARKLDISDPSGENVAHWIETSSPGLMGQSGGPIMDADGTIFAIQSNTVCLDLQFNAISKDANGEYKERQFLNVGRGISSETLEMMFAKYGVEAEWVD